MNYDYDFFNGLFNRPNNNFKTIYRNETDSRFKQRFKDLGLWGIKKVNGEDDGILTEDGEWSWMNRINTHPNCLKSFYEWCTKTDPNFFSHFGNPLYNRINIKRMWDFLDSNFELYFTKSITNEYYDELERKCRNSWNSGNVSVISILFSLNEVFNDIKNVHYSFEFGEVEDMKGGIDISFTDKNGENKTIQVKSGNILNLGDEVILDGSPNKLNYKTDYYAYSNILYNQTDIIIFKNDVDKIIKNKDNIVVKKEIIIYIKTKMMTESNKLRDILRICGKNQIDFNLKKETSLNNYVNIDIENKKVDVNISDINDENLNNLLEEKIDELTQLFKD